MGGVTNLDDVRRLGLLLASAAALGGLVVGAPAAAIPPEPEVPRPEAAEPPPSGGLIPVPAGCPSFPPADVAFVGTVLDKDEFIEKGTVRYQIDQLRAGDPSPFAVRDVIDVRYGPDSQYLDIGETYLVSASVDPTIGALASKIAPEALLFGGDAVVGLEDTEVECPDLDDPVMTINVDGTSIESGLLTPLFADRRLLLATIAVPAAVVAVVLLGLVRLRRAATVSMRGVFALGRAAVTPSPDHRAARVRRHLSDLEAESMPDPDDDEDLELVGATSGDG